MVSAGVDGRRATAHEFIQAGLRAGGCTHAYLSGSSVEQPLWRGRLAAVSRLRHYVQESASVLALGRLPLASTQKLGALAAALEGVIHALTLAWADWGGLALDLMVIIDVSFDA